MLCVSPLFNTVSRCGIELPSLFAGGTHERATCSGFIPTNAVIGQFNTGSGVKLGLVAELAKFTLSSVVNGVPAHPQTVFDRGGTAASS